MSSIVEYLNGQMKALFSSRQQKTAGESGEMVRYNSGTQCLLSGRIERAIPGPRGPLIVRVPRLELISNLQHASDDAETVHAAAPDYSNMPDAVRAIAYARGEDVQLGRNQRAGHPALARPGHGHAA